MSACGLRFVKDDGFALVLDANGIMVRVAKVPPPFTPAPFTILGWQVTAIEQMVKGLQDKGVHFERFGFFEQDQLGIWTRALSDKVAWFKDPDATLSPSRNTSDEHILDQAAQAHRRLCHRYA